MAVGEGASEKLVHDLSQDKWHASIDSDMPRLRIAL